MVDPQSHHSEDGVRWWPWMMAVNEGADVDVDVDPDSHGDGSRGRESCRTQPSDPLSDSRSNSVRKSIARVLTVINQKQRENQRSYYKAKNCEQACFF
jgi:hypothetical protein